MIKYISSRLALLTLLASSIFMTSNGCEEFRNEPKKANIEQNKQQTIPQKDDIWTTFDTDKYSNLENLIEEGNLPERNVILKKNLNYNNNYEYFKFEDKKSIATLNNIAKKLYKHTEDYKEEICCPDAFKYAFFDYIKRHHPDKPEELSEDHKIHEDYYEKPFLDNAFWNDEKRIKKVIKEFWNNDSKRKYLRAPKAENVINYVTESYVYEDKENHIDIREYFNHNEKQYKKSFVVTHNDYEQEFFFDSKESYDIAKKNLDKFTRDYRIMTKCKRELLFLDNSIETNYCGKSFHITKTDIEEHEEKLKSGKILKLQ